MAFFILSLLSARDLDIDPESCSPRDDISRGLMTREIWKRPCINLFITYFARADNMLLPFTRGQITCYCPRKMLLPRRQITHRKLCFYYTCKFGVLSIKYMIIWSQGHNKPTIQNSFHWKYATIYITEEEYKVAQYYIHCIFIRTDILIYES